MWSTARPIRRGRLIVALAGVAALVAALLLTRAGPMLLKLTLGSERVVGEVHRRLYLEPPPPALVPELFDFLMVLWDRKHAVPLAWASYLYTTHYVEAVRARPSGTPRPSPREMNAEIDRNVEFFYIRTRPTPTP